MEKVPLDSLLKPDTTVHAQALDDGDNGFTAQPEYSSNYDSSHDKRDMLRLGRKQELKRRFRYFSIAAWVVVLGNTWEFGVVTSTFSIANGGTAGAIWINIIVCIGMFLTVLSMAEVASMAPTAGGQYHWASEMAPPALQKQVSYAVGWLAVLGWQVGTPACAYIFASQILALIALCDPTYVPAGWHGALITIASAAVAITLSVYVMQRLTLTQTIAVAIHCVGFVVLLAIFWALGPGAPAYETFFHFEDQNGWGNLGVATLVGFIGPIATYIGGDSAVHLAEELQDASYILPRAMVLGSALNYVIGLVALITFMFNIGTIDDSIYAYAGQPWVAVMLRITGSKAATIVMVVVMAINFFCLQINIVMCSSRQLWAFARDKGLPFHTFLARVERNGIPRNSVAVTLALTALLALIIIGSSSAFNIILAFGNAGIYSSYVTVLSCIIWRRFQKDLNFPPTKFSLGRAGLAVNLAALVYVLVGFGFCFTPPVPNPTPAQMNWSSLMFGGILFIALIWYFLRARVEYDGPVEYVRKDVE